MHDDRLAIYSHLAARKSAACCGDAKHGMAMTDTLRSNEPTGGSAAGSRGLTADFHRIDSLIPDGQEVLAVPHDMIAVDALRLLLDHDYSQVPVKAGERVLGVFSYRSFGIGVLRHSSDKIRAEQLPVDDLLEQLRYTRPDDDIAPMMEQLTARDAILIGEPTNLLAIITASDVLNTLYSITSAYLLLQEIELALRKVINVALTEEQFTVCTKRSLGQAYQGREDELPATVTDLSFGEYVSILGHGDNWAHFQPVLGSTRAMVQARLRTVNVTRNDVLHFRRSLTSDERANLVELRDWLFMKLTAADASHHGRTVQ